jgi:hypothetical protein
VGPSLLIGGASGCGINWACHRTLPGGKSESV